MAILVIFGDTIANLSLIDYLFGLYININVNYGQKSQYFKNVPKIAYLWAKMSQLPPWHDPFKLT